MGITKYIIIALAILCVGLAITVAGLAGRISSIKAELNIAVLERDGFKAVSERQSENLDKLNILIKAAEKACMKRLEIRKAVEDIFPVVPFSSLNGGGGLLPVSRQPLSSKTISEQIDEKNNITSISYDKSVAAIGLINDSFRLFGPAGDLQ